jgi:predicted acetyltransferase
VHELCAATDAARADALAFLRGHASTADEVRWVCPADDGAFRCLRDARGVALVEPFAMARIIDIPAALTDLPVPPIDVTLRVEDPQCAWNDGVWRLYEGGGRLAVERRTGGAEKTVTIGELTQIALGYVGARAGDILPTVKTFQFESY